MCEWVVNSSGQSLYTAQWSIDICPVLESLMYSSFYPWNGTCSFMMRKRRFCGLCRLLNNQNWTIIKYITRKCDKFRRTKENVHLLLFFSGRGGASGTPFWIIERDYLAILSALAYRKAQGTDYVFLVV